MKCSTPTEKDHIQLIECPRDAWQGITKFIPTSKKTNYIKQLLSCGFYGIDVGSFVSPKAIPQMKDTQLIFESIKECSNKTRLLAIVANTKGAEMGGQFPHLDDFGFPFSISETFQMRNTHKTIEESYEELQRILEISNKFQKEMVVYLSMGFGNPFNETWNYEIVTYWLEKLTKLGIKTISLSDTIGCSTPKQIKQVFTNALQNHPTVNFGAHLHSEAHNSIEKLNAAFEAGCRRFDGAIQGVGGCPMASTQLIGNMPTEKMISYFTENKIDFGVDVLRFESCYNTAKRLFENYTT